MFLVSWIARKGQQVWAAVSTAARVVVDDISLFRGKPGKVGKVSPVPVSSVPPGGTIGGGGILVGPVSTPVVSIAPELRRVQVLPEGVTEVDVLRGVIFPPPIIYDRPPVFGGRFQYRVHVVAQPPWNPEKGENKPPTVDRWQTVTYDEPKDFMEVVVDAVAQVEAGQSRGDTRYTGTVSAVHSIQEVWYAAPGLVVEGKK